MPDDALLHLLRPHPEGVRAVELRRALRPRRTPPQIYKALQHLMQQGLVVRVGWGVYTLTSALRALEPPVDARRHPCPSRCQGAPRRRRRLPLRSPPQGFPCPLGCGRLTRACTVPCCEYCALDQRTPGVYPPHSYACECREVDRLFRAARAGAVRHERPPDACP